MKFQERKKKTKDLSRFCKNGLLSIKEEVQEESQHTNFDSSDFKEESQHTNFAHAQFFQKTYHYPH